MEQVVQQEIRTRGDQPFGVKLLEVLVGLSLGLISPYVRLSNSTGFNSVNFNGTDFNSANFTLMPQATAQIVPDHTLGGEASLVTPNVLIKGATADQIEGGAVRGANLFHSFSQFNIGDGQRVYFANPAGVDHILSRVTGADPSNLLGTLGVNGGANLFFLNPNGVFFGPNAQVDLAGSLTVSTASSFQFFDGSEFSATHPQAFPLLTIAVPIGPQLTTNSAAGPIVNTGNLTVGNHLTLHGKTVTTTGSLAAPGNLALLADQLVQVEDSQGAPVQVVTGGNLTIQGNQGINLSLLSHPNSGLWAGGHLTLRSGGTILGDAHYRARGNFRVEDLAGNLQSFTSPKDPVIRADGDVFFDSYTGASLHIFAGGSVFALGTITITEPDTVNGVAETVVLSNGQSLTIDGASFATLDIRAGTTAFNCDPLTCGTIGTPEPDFLFLSPSFAPSADIFLGSVVMANDFTTTDGLVYLTNQYSPNAAPTGTIQVNGIDARSFFGNSSAVVIDSRSDIALLGASFPANGFPGDDPINVAIAGQTFGGNGSNITLLATGDIVNNSVIVSDGFLGGQITLNTTGGSVLLGNDSTLSSISQFGFPGDVSGSITITANGLDMQPGSSIFTQNLGPDEAAGAITLNVNGPVALIGGNTSLFSQVGSETLNFQNGAGGEITIAAQSLSLTNGAQLFTRTFGPGKAGDITIMVDDGITVNNSFLFSDVRAGAGGAGGSLTLTASDLTVTNAGQLFTRTIGDGKAGDLTATAGTMSFLDRSNIFSQTEAGSTGAGGAVTFTSQGNLTINNNSRLFTRTNGQGDAGDIALVVKGDMSLRDLQFVFDGEIQSLFSEVTNQATGRGGNLNLSVAGNFEAIASPGIFTRTRGGGNAGQLQLTVAGNATLTDGTRLFSDTRTAANAGDLKLTITQNLTLENLGFVFSQVDAGATGQGGNLDIAVGGSLSALNLGGLSTQTLGEGKAGDLKVVAGNVTLDQFGVIFSIVENGAAGRGGTIDLSTAGTFTAQNNGSIATSTQGGGQAGDVLLRATQGIILNQGTLSSTNFQPTGSSAVGAGGVLTLVTDGAIALSNGSRVSTLTQTAQAAGAITLQSGGSLDLNNSVIESNSEPGATGAGGSVTITAPSLAIREGGSVRSLTGSAGNSGKVTLTIADGIVLDGINAANQISSVVSNVTNGATGNGNDVVITARSLTLTNGAQVGTATFGQGNSGNVLFQISDAVSLSGEAASGAPSIISAQSQGSGKAGDITLQTRQLTLLQGGQISSTAFDTGAGGELTIRASEVTTLSGVASNGGRSGLIASSVGTMANAGSGGAISLTTPSLTLQEGAQISVSTLGTGEAGNVVVNAQDLLVLDGDDTGIFASTAASSTGESGSIFIDPQTVRITNGAEISVSSLGSGNGGNIDLVAGDLTLDRGSITAETANGEGGNITLRVQDLVWLRNNSLISATAGGTGNGGDLDIRSQFIVAIPIENSDIIANAFQGRGGNINIATQALFGIAFQPRLTPLSGITASSEFGLQGVVIITTPDVDPSRGIVPLPGDPVDASQLISQGCSPTGESGRFIATGRGGLPPNPGELLSGNLSWEDTRLPDAKAQSSGAVAPLPAQSWVRDGAGGVTLVSQHCPGLR